MASAKWLYDRLDTAINFVDDDPELFWRPRWQGLCTVHSLVYMYFAQNQGYVERPWPLYFLSRLFHSFVTVQGSSSEITQLQTDFESALAESLEFERGKTSEWLLSVVQRGRKAL